MKSEDVNRLIEQAIHHASTKDAIRLAIKQAYMDGVESGIAAEREACAKLCEQIDAEYEGEEVLAIWCADAIRERGER